MASNGDADRPDPRDPTRPAGTTSADLVGSDWPVQATDQIVKVVDQVRDKTTGPVLSGSRAVVYGVVLAAAGSIAGLLLLIGLLRLGDLVTDRAWLTYLIAGIVFLLVGWVLWSRREPASASTTTADRS